MFTGGPIESTMIAERIRRLASDKRSGACEIFLGQVRDDEIEGARVEAIEYTAYKSMAQSRYEELREKIFDRYPIRNLDVLHSLGIVEAGETSLLVLVTSEHREEAMAACRETVDLIKSTLPIWGKELFGSEGYAWKENREKPNNG